MTIDIDKLNEAVKNPDNLNIAETNLSEIKNKKNNILQQIGLGLSKDSLRDYHKKLKDYIYVENINDIKYGHSIRFINLDNKDSDIKLSSSYIICKIQMYDNGIALVIKTFNNRHMTIYFKNYLIFNIYTFSSFNKS